MILSTRILYKLTWTCFNRPIKANCAYRSMSAYRLSWRSNYYHRHNWKKHDFKINMANFKASGHTISLIFSAKRFMYFWSQSSSAHFELQDLGWSFHLTNTQGVERRRLCGRAAHQDALLNEKYWIQLTTKHRYILMPSIFFPFTPNSAKWMIDELC